MFEKFIKKNINIDFICNKNLRRWSFMSCITSFPEIADSFFFWNVIGAENCFHVTRLSPASKISQECYMAESRINSAWIIFSSSINCEDALSVPLYLLLYIFTIFLVNLFMNTQKPCCLRFKRINDKNSNCGGKQRPHSFGEPLCVCE